MADFAFNSPMTMILLWLALAAVWGYASCKLYLENKAIAEQTPTLPTIHYMLNRLALLQRRNMQLWWFVSVILAAIATSSIYGILHPLAMQPAAPVAVATAPVKQPVPEKAPEQQRAAVAEPEPAKTTAPIPANGSVPFSDITEFNEKDSKQQAMLDWLKQRYENWLITYYYLQKCNMADKADFDLIRTSLHKELGELHVDTSQMEDNILLASNGSYNELYASASCTDERIKATKTSYEAYMEPIRKGTTKPETKSVKP